MFRIFYYLFLLFYFAVAQADSLHYQMSSLCGFTLPYLPWLTALLAIGAFEIGNRSIGHKLRRRGIHAYWVYVGMSWLAVVWVSIPFASWLQQSALLVAAMLIGCFLTRWTTRLERVWSGTRTLWQNFLPSAVALSLLFVYMGAGAGATDTDHYEMRAALALRNDQPERAVRVGAHSLAVSQRLFALRCYAWASLKGPGLGQYIFDEPLPEGGAHNLFFPDDRRQQLLFTPNLQARLLGAKRRKDESDTDYLQRCAYTERQKCADERHCPSIDYYLCALLLERKLDRFAREVLKLYPGRVADHQLPTYFAQAMVFYTRTRTQPVTVYHDAAVEANLRDYYEMRDSIANPVARCNLLRRSYGDTFWWWYTYAR